jgi:hypothetical protein
LGFSADCKRAEKTEETDRRTEKTRQKNPITSVVKQDACCAKNDCCAGDTQAARLYKKLLLPPFKV